MKNQLTQRAKLGVAVVNAMPSNTTLWDTSVTGLCARRQRSDTISYVLKLRVNGRIRWHTIGHHGQPWTPDTARKRARDILANPALIDKAPPEAALTFADVSEQFFRAHGPKLRPRTLEEYRRLERLYLLPAFARERFQTLTRGTISNAHAQWGANPRAANHALAVLSKMMTWAEDQGYRPEGSNPCRRIVRFSEVKRERFLQESELARLGSALDHAEESNLVSPFAIAAIRLLILTGARLNEILTLKWAYVDIDRRKLFLPLSKTGKKTIALSDAALAVLSDIPRLAHNPYVIVGSKHGAHLINLQKPWRMIRALANLDTVRIHDLRHTFASYAVEAGGSLPVIGRQLGHSQPQTTQRYAHLSDDPVQQLAQVTGHRIASSMQRRPACE